MSSPAAESAYRRTTLEELRHLGRDFIEQAAARDPTRLPMVTADLDLAAYLAERGMATDAHVDALRRLARAFDVTQPAIRRATSAAFERLMDQGHFDHYSFTRLENGLAFVHLDLVEPDPLKRLWTMPVRRPDPDCSTCRVPLFAGYDPTYMSMAESIAWLSTWLADLQEPERTNQVCRVLAPLARAGIDFNEPLPLGHVALAPTIRMGHLDLVRGLIDQGADVLLAVPAEQLGSLKAGNSKIRDLVIAAAARSSMKAALAGLSAPRL